MPAVRDRFRTVAIAVSMALALAPAAVPAAGMASESPEFALRATDRPSRSASVPGTISAGDIASALPAALGLWGRTSLDGAVIRVGDVEGDRLAVTSGRTITIDRDAAGIGWFVDPTPLLSAEFGLRSGDTARASGLSPAVGRVDLQTVLAHEIGHLLGRDDLGRTDSLMHERLTPGTRHVAVGSTGVTTSVARRRGRRMPDASARNTEARAPSSKPTATWRVPGVSRSCMSESVRPRSSRPSR